MEDKEPSVNPEDASGTESPEPVSSSQTGQGETELDMIRSERDEMKDKYLRLYAEFDNYRKKTQKDKEELAKFANESLVYDLLPAIDSLDMALSHATEGNGDAFLALREGVENTLRELMRVLGKNGLKPIEALGRPFDPAYHHAMSVVEKPETESNMVVEEFRKGYMFHEKVLRPSLVSVSKKV